MITPLEGIRILAAQKASDMSFLWDMLYEAAAIDAIIKAMNKNDALKLPGISKYLLQWGKEGDLALIAYDVSKEKPVGAIWYRLFSQAAAGYGYIADDIPELSMAVTSEYRGKGIGKLLLQTIIKDARQSGYKALSLSVSKHNSARRLYESIGFVDAQVSKPEDTSVTMKITL